MKVYIKVVVIIFSLLHVKDVYSQTWIPLDNTTLKGVTTSVLVSDNDTYKLRMQLHGVHDVVTNVSGINYHELIIDNCFTLTKIGEPALPLVTKTIAVPQGCDYVMEISDEIWVDIEVGKLFPFQKPLLETESPSTFTVNESIYESEQYFVNTLSFKTGHIWRGIESVNLAICPFRYYPSKGKLSVLKECVVTVNFTPTMQKTKRVIQKNTNGNELHQYENIDMIMQNLSRKSATVDSEQYDFLIISCSQDILNCQSIKDFCKWKALKGFKTKVVSTDITGKTCSEIKNYISNEYQKGIKYVLFIGDDDQIPLYDKSGVTYSYDIIKGDYWYGCMDGSSDLIGDIAIGRLSTNNSSEVANMVEKIIKYESENHQYYNKVLLMANKENAPGKYQGCLETIRNTTYTLPMTFTTAYGASTTVGGNNSTNSDVISKINSGLNILNYRGHGDENSWTYWNTLNESFYGSLVENFTGTSNSVVFSIACSTGDISNNTCMLEKFMNDKKGSVAYLGATVPSFTNANHTFNQFLFTKLLNENVYNMGLLNIAAHMKNLEYTNYATTAQDNVFCYLCGGDPSLEIWTAKPMVFSGVTINPTLGAVRINTNNVNGCTVSIVSESGTLLNHTIMKGTTCTIPVSESKYYVAINKHNYIPYVLLKSVDGVYIQNITFNNNVSYNQGSVYIGYDVTDEKKYGNVIVKSGSTLTLKNASEVVIKNGFECEKGAALVIE